MRCGNPRSPSSRQVSSSGTASRGGSSWYPRWYWPSFALPATLFLLVFFLFPFYVVLSVAFGGVSDILREPLPAWNPLACIAAHAQTTFRGDAAHSGREAGEVADFESVRRPDLDTAFWKHGGQIAAEVSKPMAPPAAVHSSASALYQGGTATLEFIF